MERFTRITSVAAPMPQDDIDTDIIYPARFLLITEKTGLGRYAFADWRTREDYILAQPTYSGARILIAGANFGCGSSREQAPWALADLGICCIVAPSFGEIFYGNCFNNGILPIIADGPPHAALMADAMVGLSITVDLESCSIRRSDSEEIAFAVEPRRREALLEGWDGIDIIRATQGAAIDAFEHIQQGTQPWLWHHDLRE